MEKAVVKDFSKCRKIEIDNRMVMRFEINKKVGEGGFGVVWKATDKKTHEVIALKKLFGAFRNPFFAKRTYREVSFLQAFSKHENIITLRSIHRAVNNMDLYLEFDFMETDLETAIHKKSLNDKQKQYIMYQVLCATKYMHASNVIHRDQKPSNILLDHSCNAKLADFGLARCINNLSAPEPELDVQPVYTGNLGTRWYKAPEILLGSHKYTTSVDMWSLGCILAEMLLGEALFRGTSGNNQVERILAALHMPHEIDIEDWILADDSQIVYDNIKNGTALSSILEGCPKDASDLIQKLLVISPEIRLTAEQALNHRYINKSEFVKQNGREIMPVKVLLPFSDCVQLPTKAYKDKLYEFTSSYKTEDHLRKRDGPGQKKVTAAPERKRRILKRHRMTARRGRNKVANAEEQATATRKPGPNSALHKVRPHIYYQTRLQKLKTMITRQPSVSTKSGIFNSDTVASRLKLGPRRRCTVHSSPGAPKDLQLLQIPNKELNPDILQKN